LKKTSDAESVMKPDDFRALVLAKRDLEKQGMWVRPIIWTGDKLGMVLPKMPRWIGRMVEKLGEWALGRALTVALTTMNLGTVKKARKRTHKIMAMTAGAFGGLLGWITLALELPFSTVVMMRGIAEVARAEGEDLTLPESRLACLSVFAMDQPRHKGKERGQWRLFAARAGMGKLMGEAAQVAGTRNVAAASAPAVVRFVHAVAGRFGITVSEKAAAQSIPILGAIGGASINGLLMGHYLRLAHGLFTVRRLEREYGEALVGEVYDSAKF